MSKPRSKNNRAKTKIAPVRLTEAELQRIDDVAESQGLNRSELIRQKLKTDIKTEFKENPQITSLIASLQEIKQELSPIGNNLNQLTREVNTAIASGQNIPEYINNPCDLNELNKAIASLSQTIRGLILEVKAKK